MISVNTVLKAMTCSIFVWMLCVSTANAEIFTKKFHLCNKPNTISCGQLYFWNLGGALSGVGTLTVHLSVRDADESSIHYDVRFRNGTECKVDINGSFLRNDHAVAVVEWGTLILDPGEEIRGDRVVHRLRDTAIGEDVNLSLRAATFECD